MKMDNGSVVKSDVEERKTDNYMNPILVVGLVIGILLVIGGFIIVKRRKRIENE